MHRRHLGSLTLSVGIALSLAVAADAPQPAFIHTHDATARLNYLANAAIWRDPGEVTPASIRSGPAGSLPAAFASGGVECRFDRAGLALGGRTPKFMCRTSDGRSVRLKYYDGTDAGNREVFGSVAATRLLAALGFDADAAYALHVTCHDCPANPYTGVGPTARREYAGMYEPRNNVTLITSTANPDQGWTFGELDTAIASLPPGPHRDRQRMHFDALSLVAAFLQHGDRKASQQRLACQGAADLEAGDMHGLSADDSSSFSLPVLFERPATRACNAGSMATLQDVGATFGSAGQFTHHIKAKMHLASWASIPVFGPPSADDLRRAAGALIPCYGRLTASGTAGDGARDNPRIGEAGRAFLAAQFARLSPDHVRALFEAARIDEIPEPHTWRDRRGTVYQGIDAWSAVFADKVRQISEATCAP